MFVLRIARVRVVVDQRDPYLDFEIARGVVQPGSLKNKLLAINEKIMLYTSSLIILPSKAYEELLLREGAPVGKVVGLFRGVDLELFNPSVDGSLVRRRLGIEGKFVVGWFGVMHRHLLVKEVLLPLALRIGELVPSGFMLIGGKGPDLEDVISAKKACPDAQFDYVGLVPYGQLPEYLAACDILLCPVSTKFRFSRHSNWLKILEGLAVARPVIATRTVTTEIDMRTLKGVIWTGQEFTDFKSTIELAYSGRSSLQAAATEQSRHLEEFSVSSTIPRILDRINATLK